MREKSQFMITMEVDWVFCIGNIFLPARVSHFILPNVQAAVHLMPTQTMARRSPFSRPISYMSQIVALFICIMS